MPIEHFIVIWTNGSKSDLWGATLRNAMDNAGLVAVPDDAVWLWEVVNGTQVSPAEAAKLMEQGHDCALYGEGWRHTFECELCIVSI